MTGFISREAGSIWETWYDILFNPFDAMKTIALEQRKIRAILSLIAGMIPLWAAYFAISEQSNELTGLMIGFHVLGEAAIWICGSALLHMTAVLVGGRGEATGLLCTFGYVGLPQLFLIPIVAIIQCLPAGLRSFAIAAGLAVLAFWSFSLKVLALKGCYGFSATKALLVLLIPFLVLLAGVALVVLLLSASALSMVFLSA